MGRRVTSAPAPIWRTSYTRDVSPGRAARKRIDLRVETKPQVVLEGTEADCLQLMVNSGFAQNFANRTCKCGELFGGLVLCGKPGNKFAVHRCRGRTRHKRSPWHGTIWSDSDLSVRHRFNVAVGYASGMGPTQAVVDKGINRGTASQSWRFFRRAEADAGAELRASTVFSGTLEMPHGCSFFWFGFSRFCFD